MATRIYPADLVLVRNEHDEIETDFQPFIDLIINSVATRSWADNGGIGSISACQFQDRCVLVVTQTQEVHEELTAFLGALRRFSNGDIKNGTELRLPKRPAAVTPKYYIVPEATRRSNFDGVTFGCGLGTGGRLGGKESPASSGHGGQ